jgi:leucyl/phenylalanyl-tRNA--protein transferase
MADGRDDPHLFLVDPESRGILPLEQFHVPRRLARTVKSDVYHVRIDHAFREVVEACAAPHASRPETWINQPILELYDSLHRRGMAHSVECWQNEALVGGLYGVRIGGAFFGESMFSRARDASKVALVHLVAHLIVGGFKLLDTQFLTAHLQQFGTQEVSRADYRSRLEAAINSSSSFPSIHLLEGAEPTLAQDHPPCPSPHEVDLKGVRLQRGRESRQGPGARCLLALVPQVPHFPHN